MAIMLPSRAAGRSPGQTAIEASLRKRLRVHAGKPPVLLSRENSTLEFKESFNLANKPRYGKTMAAFANNSGGFIVFGVKNAPHELVGLKGKRFEEFDPAELSRFLDGCFAPPLQWESGQVEAHGITLGYIYTSEAPRKPVLCSKSVDSSLQEGAVYFRYRGQSTQARYGDLREILDGEIIRERRALLGHMQLIADAGARNVAVIDLVRGSGSVGSEKLLIDEALVRELTFIKEGSFKETGGEPALRLIGSVQPVAGVPTGVQIPVAVHIKDLIAAFLAQRQLDPSTARLYLEECARQTSPYVPIHCFRHHAGLSPDDAQRLLSNTQTEYPGTRKKIIARLRGAVRIGQQGVTDPGIAAPTDAEDLNTRLVTGATRHVRSVLLAALRSNATVISDDVLGTHALRVCEAATHLTSTEISERRDAILNLLLRIVSNHFAAPSSGLRTAVRKAVAFVDEALFLDLQGLPPRTPDRGVT